MKYFIDSIPLPHSPSYFPRFSTLAFGLTFLITGLCSQICHAHSEPVAVTDLIQSTASGDQADQADDRTPVPSDPTFDFANTKKSRGPASDSSALSGLPPDVSEGFMIKVLYQNTSTMFWVVKRIDKFDLLYANTHGSQGSIGLSPELFHRLEGIVATFKATTLNVSKCKTSNIRLDTIVAGKPSKSVVTCVGQKGTEPEKLRGLTNSLSSLIQ